MVRSKKTPANPVTEADRARFAQFIRKWQALLCLADWRYVIDEKPSKYMAEIFSQESDHRLVRIRLGAHFGQAVVNDETMESTAIHENLHVLLHGLIEACIKDSEYSDQVRAEEHRAITVLERLILRLAQLDHLNDRAEAAGTTLEALVIAAETGKLAVPMSVLEGDNARSANKRSSS